MGLDAKENYYDIVIVGGGCSGLLVAIHLMRYTHQPLRLAIIEKTKSLGKGAAFGTTFSGHVLNVPSGSMSALAQAPLHFLEWLNGRNGKFGKESVPSYSFVARELFHQYLLETFRDYRNKISHVQLDCFFEQNLVSIDDHPGEVFLKTEVGLSFRAGKAVLAVGNFAREKPFGEQADLYSHPCYIDRAWSYGILDSIQPNDAVLIVGTGPSMLDVILYLKENGHKRCVDAISRHGLLPRPFPKESPGDVNSFTVEEGMSLLEIYRTFRIQVKKKHRQGGHWRSLFQQLRKISPVIWAALSEEDQRRFFRHVLPFWTVYRHNIPYDVSTIIEGMMANGALNILKGRINEFVCLKETIQAQIHLRGGEKASPTVDWIINCTGLETDYSRVASPPIQKLLGQKKVTTGKQRQGLYTNSQGILIDENGTCSPTLYAIGTITKRLVWDSFAMPELVDQADAIARHAIMMREQEDKAK